MKMDLTNLNANINIFLNVKMGITGANRCYFVVWNPHETHIELIEFDSVFLRNTKNDFNFFDTAQLKMVPSGTITFCRFLSHGVYDICEFFFA